MVSTSLVRPRECVHEEMLTHLCILSSSVPSPSSCEYYSVAIALLLASEYYLLSDDAHPSYRRVLIPSWP